MMQASGEPCHNVGSLRAIWSRLPLFWRFQLAGWAAFVPLTFPLKVVLAGTIPGALLLSFNSRRKQLCADAWYAGHLPQVLK